MTSKALQLALPPLAVTLGFAAWGLLAAGPDAPVPDNWGLNAKPEAVGGRGEAFVALPAIAILIVSILALAPRLDRRSDNLRRSQAAYLTSWIGLLSFVAIVQTGLSLRSLELWRGDDYGPMLPLWAGGLSLLVAASGNVFGKARPNWFVGVRTPWTLRSEWTWDRTHRFAGRLFVLLGLLSLLVAVARSANEAMVVLTLGIAGAALASVAYSYFAWRRAPDRR